MKARAREALARLRAGNERFLSGQSRRDATTCREIRALVAGQDPPAIILSCADSRVPTEKVFDAGVGGAVLAARGGQRANERACSKRGARGAGAGGGP